MNIPLTPIDEAWNIGKAKHTVANRYTTLRTQRKLLSDAGQVTGEFVPTGIDAMAISHQEVPSPQPEQHPEPQPGRAQPAAAGKAITVTSPEALEALRPYNDEFISDLVARLVVQHLKGSAPPRVQAGSPKAESFTGRYAQLAADTLQDDNVFVTLVLAVVLLYSIDILIRGRS